MGIRECCSTFLAALPGPSLPLLPSFILGLICSGLILMFVYARESKLGLRATLKLALSNVFCLFPTHHSDRDACANPDCVRCHKYHEVKSQVVEKWRQMKRNDPNLELKRVEEAVRKLREKFNPTTNQGDQSKSSPEVNSESEGGDEKGSVLTKRSAPVSKQDDGSKDKRSEEKKTLFQNQKPTLFHMDLAANPLWGDLPVFQNEMELLKLNFSIILQEYKAVFAAVQDGDHTGWKLNDLERGHWCIFPLLDQGVVNEANSQRCPNTAALLSALPAVMKDCVFGNASFSCLYPDSYIAPHYGPTNIRLRCHLGLEIPSGCLLEVDGTQHTWSIGECLVFDDSYLHSATHAPTLPGQPQTGARSLLMVDFWHPSIDAREKKVLKELLAP